ncbi:hypothetical protein GA0115244_104613, partial [Streptomyces sp. DvalAA-19]
MVKPRPLPGGARHRAELLGHRLVFGEVLGQPLLEGGGLLGVPDAGPDPGGDRGPA